jgi:Ni/Co efflux regulator RcnB
MMKSLGFCVLAGALLATSGTAFAAGDSGRVISTTRTVTSAPIGNIQKVMPIVKTARPSRWAGRQDGRWIGGVNAPGGWSAYRAPFRGFVLPGYWTQPSFFVGNYERYGFAQPQSGYGWSRYYDDAVLTDGSGRVLDVVQAVNWDSVDDDEFVEDYRDSYGYGDEGRRRPGPSEVARGRDRDGGLGGALVGGAVGAVAGNIIGGKGDRLAGSLIGGGVGALAGLAIDNADRAGRVGEGLSRKERRRLDRDRYGDYRGRRPHWRGDYYDDYYRGGYYCRSGCYGGGFAYVEPVVTTITFPVQPIVTTTVTTRTTEHVVYGKTYYKVWKKRPAKHHHRCQCH